MLLNVQVAHFLRDKRFERWAEELAVALHQHRGPRQLWGGHLLPQLADLPEAALDSVLRHLVSITPLGLAARLLHPRFVSAAVRVCMQGTTLNLRDQFQSSADLEHLLPSIPHSHDLSAITLTYGTEAGQGLFVQDDADSALAAWLRTQPLLHTVTFSGLQLGAASLMHGVAHLGPSLRSLCLSRCSLKRFGPAPLAQILQALPHLTHLDLSCNSLQATNFGTVTRALGALTALRALHLAGNGIRIAGAQALAAALPPLRCLTALDFSNNVVQAAGFAALAPRLAVLSGLAVLDVSGSVFATPGAATLARLLPALPALESLGLAWNAIGDAGVAALRDGLAPRAPAQPPPLTHLCLRNNTLSRQCSHDLGVVLHALCGTLRSLDLSWNRINWSASVLSGALASMHELRTLLLRENNMHNSGYAALLPAIAHLPHLRHLDVSDNLLTSDPLGLLLEAIAAHGPEPSPGPGPTGGARPIVASPHACAGAAAPVTHPALTVIDTSNMSGGGLGSPTAPLAADPLVAAAAAVPGGAEGVAALADAAPDAALAVLDALQEIFDKVLAGINRCERNSICAAASRVRVPGLQRLVLCGLPDSVQCAVPLLGSCGGSLMELNLDSVALRPALAAALATPLRACSALTSLDLANNACMGPLGGAALAHSVRAVLPHLHRLVLSGCGHPGGMIVRACFPDDAATPARAVLVLRSLNVSRTAVDQATALPLLAHLAHRAPRLRRLDLGDTQVAAGPERLAVQSALARLTQVTMLSLANIEGFAVPDWHGLWPHVPL